jgi:hypothetical protein
LSMRGISLPTELKQPDETPFHPQIFGVKPAISGAVAQNCAFLVFALPLQKSFELCSPSFDAQPNRSERSSVEVYLDSSHE